MKKLSKEEMRKINGGGYICDYCQKYTKYKAPMQKHQWQKHYNQVRAFGYSWRYNWFW